MISAPRNSESGNVFLIILLGVALFAALGFTLARTMRTSTTETLSARDADLAATDILSYAQDIERGIDRLRQKGISENDISFENDIVAGYAHTPVVTTAERVFHAAGGRASWRSPPPGANDGSPWYFTGRTCIPDIGTGSAGCGTDTISNEELVAVLPNLKQSVCENIDKKLGIGAIPANTGDAISSTKFTGPFADGTETVPGGAYSAACYSEGANFIFYYVLLAR